MDYFGFWKNKRVLVTGHTGFTGTWLSIMLNKLGAIVGGYSLPVNPYLFYAEAGVQVAEHFEGDIVNKEQLERAVNRFKPEIIFHLASHSSLKGSDKIPGYILRTNIMGVVNLLEIARNIGDIKSVVIVTSDKCYKNVESEKAYTEDCELGGVDPYSVSKVCQELITNCFRETFFDKEISWGENYSGIATARASNIIGIGDYNYTRLIPYVLDSFISGKTAQLRNPDAIRPWQYVLDVVWGYLLLGQKIYGNNSFNGSYNFGPNEDGFQKVESIVKILSTYFPDAKYSFGEVKRSVQKETKILKLDSTKAQTLLGWFPFYNIEKISEEIAWFIDRKRQKESIDRLCNQMVDRYLEKVGE